MSGEAPARPMKYPYTYAAKLAQYPYAFHFKNHWFIRYYVFGFFASYPLFIWIHNKVNSPANKAVWAEKKRKEKEHHH